MIPISQAPVLRVPDAIRAALPKISDRPWDLHEAEHGWDAMTEDTADESPGGLEWWMDSAVAGEGYININCAMDCYTSVCFPLPEDVSTEALVEAALDVQRTVLDLHSRYSREDR